MRLAIVVAALLIYGGELAPGQPPPERKTVAQLVEDLQALPDQTLLVTVAVDGRMRRACTSARVEAVVPQTGRMYWQRHKDAASEYVVVLE